MLGRSVTAASQLGRFHEVLVAQLLAGVVVQLVLRLEYGGGWPGRGGLLISRPGRRSHRYRPHGRIIGRAGDVVLLLLVGQVVLVLLGRVRVARIAGHVRELPFIAVRIDVAVFAAHHAIGTTSFLLERAVRCLVAESERSVVVHLVVIANGLDRRRLR